jgi:hypothetical protein
MMFAAVELGQVPGGRGGVRARRFTAGGIMSQSSHAVAGLATPVKKPKSRSFSFFRDRGLTLVMMGLFLLFVVGVALTGVRDFNEQQRQRHAQPVTLGAYLGTGHFWEAMGENWESEFLQMAAFVMLTACLYQRGSPESKDPDEFNPQDEDPRAHAGDPNAPWPVRRGGWVLAVYEHSLSLAFVALFLGSILLHAWGGVQEYNADQLAHGQEAIGFLGYFATSQFWFESFQNWQSEFLAIASMVYLSVYLRQRGSAESKPVHVPHDRAE